MDQALTTLLEMGSKVGPVGIALLALYWMRQDKAEAVKAFTALNEERRQMAERMHEVIEQQAVNYATMSAKYAALEQYIRDKIK